MNMLGYVLQGAPNIQQGSGMMGDSMILGPIYAVSVLLVTVGILYVLIKVGRFLDAVKDKV
jgi:cation transporter-like permease